MLNIKLPRPRLSKPTGNGLRHMKGLPRRIILTIRRRKLATLALLFVVAAILYIVTNPAVVGVSAGVRELPVYSVERDNKAVSLTFDAAWADVRLRHANVTNN